MPRHGTIVRPVFTILAAAALLAACVAPAQAATVHPTKYQTRTLNTFLGAFTSEHVSPFSRSAGPSAGLLVRFGVWRTYHTNFSAVRVDSESYGLVSSRTVDAVDLKYFGRKVKSRRSYSSIGITYARGRYRFMPGDGDPVHAAKFTKVTSSKGRVWTVYLKDLSRPEWSTGAMVTVGRYRATVKLTGSRSKPHYALLAWRKL
jgi:hypothetical protein